MPACEFCTNEHDGSFGSGRFCKIQCATAVGRRGNDFRPGADTRRRVLVKGSATAMESGITSRRVLLLQQALLSWEDASRAEKVRRIRFEQAGRCLCGINIWMGAPLTLQLHHIDANRSNMARSNLSLLCPNCHSQTENFCMVGRKLKRTSNDDLLMALHASPSIHAALKSLGLNPTGGNFTRAKNLLAQVVEWKTRQV